MDPKYAHLSDDLHVEITAIAPPAEAHARIAFALAEVRKYLIPDNNDNIRQEQMREMEMNLTDDPISDDRRSSIRGPSGGPGAGGILRPTARPTLPRTSRGELYVYNKILKIRNVRNIHKCVICRTIYLMFIDHYKKIAMFTILHREM